MNRRIILALIIMLSPLAVLAHEGHEQLSEPAGTLPGEGKYLFEKIGEWLDVNIFTLGTKDKQTKKLRFATERLSELTELITRTEQGEDDVREAVKRYRNFLYSAENMAEVIIFLDGREIAVAEKLEDETRHHEQVIGEYLGFTNLPYRSYFHEALNEARTVNEQIFKFMVEKYQITDDDVEKHRKILDGHFEIVEVLAGDTGRTGEVAALLTEARNHQKAGLNARAYELLNEAKNILY